MTFASKAAALTAELGAGPIFVHSDVLRTARLVRASRDKVAFLDAHIALLRELSGERGVWLPAFNYDYPQSHVFDMARDPAQIGPIPERFRTSIAQWRTPVPMFSVSGVGAAPAVTWGDVTDPFGNESIFARMLESDAVVLYYGDTFSSNTLVHFSERKYGGPPYRYDKRFPGRVIQPEGMSLRGTLCCHVRPLGKDLDYDWDALLALAVKAGVCRPVEGSPEVMAASARTLSDFWIGELRKDPLALLDAKSRAWVEPALDRLGRRFEIDDFEPPRQDTDPV